MTSTSGVGSAGEQPIRTNGPSEARPITPGNTINTGATTGANTGTEAYQLAINLINETFGKNALSPNAKDLLAGLALNIKSANTNRTISPG